MKVEDIYRRLAVVFQDVFDDDAIVPTPTMTAKDVEGWDSLTHIRLIVSVEKQFSVRFTTAEIGRVENVGDFVSLIEQKTALQK